MEKLSFRVADYEGPLDLILFLITKHKLDILDIRISDLLEQYLAIISEWEEDNPDLSSEFLEMAARLVYMKTVSLLPKHEEESEKLREELIGQLLELSLCKQAAAYLQEKYRGGDIFVREPQAVIPDQTYRRIHPARDILSGYLSVLGKKQRRIPPPASAFSGIVARRIVSVTSRIGYLLRRFYKEEKIRFDQLFTESADRSELVATFLAVLELLKEQRIVLDADGHTLQVKQRAERPADGGAH